MYPPDANDTVTSQWVDVARPTRIGRKGLISNCVRLRLDRLASLVSF